MNGFMSMLSVVVVIVPLGIVQSIRMFGLGRAV